MNTRGFRGFTKPTDVTEEYVNEKLTRLDHKDLYIFWTGSEYRFRAGSGRGGVLRSVKTKRRPLSLKKVIWDARTTAEGLGYTPEFVRSAAFLHRASKPTVFYLLRRDEDGNYRAACPTPAASLDLTWEALAPFAKKGLKGGEVLIRAKAKGEVKPEADALIAPTEAPALEAPKAE